MGGSGVGAVGETPNLGTPSAGSIVDPTDREASGYGDAEIAEQQGLENSQRFAEASRLRQISRARPQ
jgi:hypothetical protein